MELKKYIRDIPDFPKPGILFRDITPLLALPAAFQYACQQLTLRIKAERPDVIIGIESRGFIFAAPIALLLGVPFVPVRKPGKLPSEVSSVEYSLEYGSGRLDMHVDAIKPGDRVAIIDDLLATGGTAKGAAQLVSNCGGIVCAFAFLIELRELHGRERLQQVPIHCLLEY